MSSPRIKRAVNGVLMLDKARGGSSNAALQQAKRLYQAAKAGHAGTLDPLATGLFLSCSAKPPSFPPTCLMPTNRTPRKSGWASAPPPRMPKAR